MRSARTAALVVGVLGLVLGVAGPAQALPPSALSITVPGPVNLGSGSPGQTLSAKLGQVTVSGGATEKQAWTATVTLSGQFTVTQSGQSWTFPSSRVSYWAGGGTGTLLGTLTCTSGQPTALAAQTLASARTAYSCPAISTLLVSGWSLTWNPTLVVTTQSTDPAGTYTGTITHSVA